MAAVLEIVSSRTVESPGGGKRHIGYSVVVKTPSDIAPMVIERRYNDFLQLYRSLIKKNSDLNGFVFPKKVIIGNFGNSVISARRASFEEFLRIIASNERMRDSPEMKRFLIGHEEKEALRLLNLKCFHLARPYLLRIFTLLNKVYTEKHPAVIVALCRLAACCHSDPSALTDAEKFTEMAIRRFESVSDVDLLRFYIPLLQMASQLWWTLGKDKSVIDARINTLKRQGHRVDGGLTLFDMMLNIDY